MIHACVRAQTWANVEWLVHDDSPEPSAYMQGVKDTRIRYEHDPERRTTGGKRNLLVERARGAIIAHFDDDDFYAPGYLASLAGSLEKRGADFAKLEAFYLYHAGFEEIAYWDMTNVAGLHDDWRDPERRGSPRVHPEDPDEHLGYGFSYVYRRKVWERTPFPDVRWNEDGPFALAAVRDFQYAGLRDQIGLALHIQHGRNSSRSYPQYRFPPFLNKRLFPGAEPYFGALRTIMQAP